VSAGIRQRGDWIPADDTCSADVGAHCIRWVCYVPVRSNQQVIRMGVDKLPTEAALKHF